MRLSICYHQIFTLLEILESTVVDLTKPVEELCYTVFSSPFSPHITVVSVDYSNFIYSKLIPFGDIHCSFFDPLEGI